MQRKIEGAILLLAIIVVDALAIKTVMDYAKTLQNPRLLASFSRNGSPGPTGEEKERSFLQGTPPTFSPCLSPEIMMLVERCYGEQISSCPAQTTACLVCKELTSKEEGLRHELAY